MAERTVEYKIKISKVNGDVIKEIKTQLEGLGATVDMVETKAKDLNATLINYNQITQVFQNVNQAVSALSGMFNEMTGAAMKQENW
jgi:hypothetical protein